MLQKNKPDNESEVFIITDAAHGRSVDQQKRQYKYLTAMILRTLCFVLAITLPIDLVWRIALIGMAIILPYIAVVVATIENPTSREGSNLIHERGNRKLLY